MGIYASGAKSYAICDRCGFKYQFLSLREEWTGHKVCSDCWEPKHPQLEPRSAVDATLLHKARPGENKREDASPRIFIKSFLLELRARLRWVLKFLLLSLYQAVSRVQEPLVTLVAGLYLRGLPLLRLLAQNLLVLGLTCRLQVSLLLQPLVMKYPFPWFLKQVSLLLQPLVQLKFFAMFGVTGLGVTGLGVVK